MLDSYKRLSALVLLVALLAVPLEGFGAIGVGVTTGKIFVTESLKQGSLNEINPVTVVNTGSVPSEYTVSVGYHMQQEELRPPEEWFTFTPQTFHLEPGETQRVRITLELPIKDVRPDEYLAYIEAEPVKRSERGEGTSVGVAAATKLFFSVAPANIFQGIYYRTASLFEKYSPWSYVGLGVIAFVTLVVLFRKYFAFNIKIQKKQ